MKFVYTKPDGGVAIVSAAPKADLERVLGPMTRAQYRQHVIERSIPKGVEYRELPDDWVAPDRAFRNAWIAEGSAVSVDMGKARQIHMGRVRWARDKKLEAMDREWMAATNNPAKAVVIEAVRQVLRDIPQTFDLSGAATPEELKTLWPEELT